jgi:AraC-like DNA-binding protein
MARSKRKPQEQQPRALSPEVGLQPVLYKAGMYAQLQQFGSSERDRQLLLWPAEDPPETEVTVSGLDLTVSEAKALQAVQILLDRTDYQGNKPGQQIHSQAFQWEGTPPRLAITHREYFEAYGLEEIGGRYQGHQVQEALEALKSLAATPRTIYYKRRHWRGKKQLFDIVRAKSPLIKLTELTAYKDLEQEEAEEVEAGQEVAGKIRATGLLIEASPLLVDSIADFYLLKPSTLHKEIQQLHGSKRISRTLSLFIEWLLTKNAAIVKIDRNKLIDRLRLTSYIQRRHKEIAEARLQEAFQTAKELGYLLGWREEPIGMLLFELNSERCSRVKKKTEAEEVKRLPQNRQ